MYNIDFDILTQLLLPPRLRQSKMVAWVRLLLNGVETVFNRFKYTIDNIDNKLIYNGQVAYLQKAISDNIISCVIEDNTDPQWQLYLYNIIDDSSDLVYFFNDTDSSDPLFIPVWLFNSADYNYEADYYICIPTSDLDAYRMIIYELVKNYNNASKKYNLKILITLL